MSTDIPEKMTAVYLNGHGGFDRLEYREDVPVPQLMDDEVLIRVGAAGIHNTDINTRIAWYSKSVTSDITYPVLTGSTTVINRDGSDAPGAFRSGICRCTGAAGRVHLMRSRG